MILSKEKEEINVVFTQLSKNIEEKYDYDLKEVIRKYNNLTETCLNNSTISTQLYSSINLEKYCSYMQDYYLKNENDLVIGSLAMNFAMNAQQIIPPSMRGFERIKKHKGLSKAEATYSLDLQVIDLHWLFAYRQKTNQLRAKKINDLVFVQDGKFQLDAAYSFAQKPWSHKKKAEALLMDELEETLSYRIMSTKISNRKNDFYKEKASYVRCLYDYCNKPKSRLNTEDIPKYLTFLEALKLAGGNDRTAAEVHSYLSRQGKLDEEQISSYSKMINNRKLVLKRVGF
tara:strand:+ start:2068 stop:2928 length:861 start_codon:yes stop_codon:yes gene_type:complete